MCPRRQQPASPDDWFRASGVPRSVRVALPTGVKELTYFDIAGSAIFEGDIYLGSVEDLELARRENRLIPQGIARKGDRWRWPNGRVAYQFRDGLKDDARIAAALAHWREKTKLTFVERTAANGVDLPDFIVFENRGACYSSVGRQEGEQVISVGPSCPAGSVVHEIGHAVGLWHEQSRADRDTYVTVIEDNVDPRYLPNFRQHIEDGSDLGDYDYGSIMHYPSTAFSYNGQPTIVPKNGEPIGQRSALSEGDLRAVRAIYPELYPGAAPPAP